MLIIPNMTYTTHHPPNFLLPHVWCIIFHDFSSPSLCWSSHAWLPPTTCHPPTQPPLTQLFVSPCMIHHFSQFFKPFIMLIIPCMISTTHPPTTTNPTFCYPIYDTLFLKIFQAQHYADHPMHDFHHPTATHPIFCFPMYDTSFFTIFQAHHCWSSHAWFLPPNHQSPTNSSTTHPTFCFPNYDASFFTIFQAHHCWSSHGPHNFGPSDPKFW